MGLWTPIGWILTAMGAGEMVDRYVNDGDITKSIVKAWQKEGTLTEKWEIVKGSLDGTFLDFDGKPAEIPTEARAMAEAIDGQYKRELSRLKANGENLTENVKAEVLEALLTDPSLKSEFTSTAGTPEEKPEPDQNDPSTWLSMGIVPLVLGVGTWLITKNFKIAGAVAAAVAGTGALSLTSLFNDESNPDEPGLVDGLVASLGLDELIPGMG